MILQAFLTQLWSDHNDAIITAAIGLALWAIKEYRTTNKKVERMGVENEGLTTKNLGDNLQLYQKMIDDLGDRMELQNERFENEMTAMRNKMQRMVDNHNKEKQRYLDEIARLKDLIKTQGAR